MKGQACDDPAKAKTAQAKKENGGTKPMNKTFTFQTPIHLYKITNGKTMSIGFFKSYAEAEKYRKVLGNSFHIDNNIKSRFFDAEIFDEKEIAERIKKAFD